VLPIIGGRKIFQILAKIFTNYSKKSILLPALDIADRFLKRYSQKSKKDEFSTAFSQTCKKPIISLKRIKDVEIVKKYDQMMADYIDQDLDNIEDIEEVL
jgi:hypothetical protein